MPKDPKRSKLKKYLGKDIKYNAKIKFKKNSIILEDVSHKNKLLTDHIWLDKKYNLTSIPENSCVTFQATAYSYIDSKKIRKYGLDKIYGISKEYCSTVSDQVIVNQKAKQFRLKGNKNI